MKPVIAFVTQYDATDPASWSGTATFLARALERHGAAVSMVGGLRRRDGATRRLRKLLMHRPRSATYLVDRDPRVLAAYAREIDARLPAEADVLLFPGSFPAPGFIRDRRPCVAYTDGSFHALLDFYPEYRTLCPRSVLDGIKAEEAALRRCAHIVYSSPWARDTARERYPFIAGKSTVVAFGANLDQTMDPHGLNEAILRRGRGPCRLLFVGKDWMRKRLALVFETMAALAGRGIEVELDLVGVQGLGPLDPSLPVRDWGLLDTSVGDGRATYLRLLAEADFMMLPSAAECFGICLCEAASRGVPGVAAAVGGIPSIVRNGDTGYTLPANAGPGEYADVIEAAFSDRLLYRRLAEGAFREYTSRLNWDAAVEAILPILRGVM
jgi:glycosyltransferase involved in cell wall biosynthesis